MPGAVLYLSYISNVPKDFNHDPCLAGLCLLSGYVCKNGELSRAYEDIYSPAVAVTHFRLFRAVKIVIQTNDVCRLFSLSANIYSPQAVDAFCSVQNERQSNQ